MKLMVRAMQSLRLSPNPWPVAEPETLGNFMMGVQRARNVLQFLAKGCSLDFPKHKFRSTQTCEFRPKLANFVPNLRISSQTCEFRGSFLRSGNCVVRFLRWEHCVVRFLRSGNYVGAIAKRETPVKFMTRAVAEPETVGILKKWASYCVRRS